jgi:hypothetical protein
VELFVIIIFELVLLLRGLNEFKQLPNKKLFIINYSYLYYYLLKILEYNHVYYLDWYIN